MAIYSYRNKDNNIIYTTEPQQDKIPYLEEEIVDILNTAFGSIYKMCRRFEENGKDNK